ncbi:MAG: hypothetical protein R3F43_13100 [bacterium]
MGGLKVFPVEVEEAIAALPGVLDCAVFGGAHALTGRWSRRGCGWPRTSRPWPSSAMRQALRGAGAFKVPVKVTLTDGELVSDRFKKVRR